MLPPDTAAPLALDLSSRGTAEYDRQWYRAGNKKLEEIRNFLNWLCLLNNYSEVFLEQLLPMSVSLKLTHSASDLKQSMHT